MVRVHPRPIRKRPRKFHKFEPILSRRNECNEFCNACLEKFQEIVDKDRPDHYWRVEDGQIRYKEDDAAERMLGRKLKPTESVIVKNGDFKDCRPENLEIVSIEGLEAE